MVLFSFFLVCMAYIIACQKHHQEVRRNQSTVELLMCHPIPNITEDIQDPSNRISGLQLVRLLSIMKDNRAPHTHPASDLSNQSKTLEMKS